MNRSRVYTVEGVIISRRNTAETDRVLVVFSKEIGKFSCLAKGIRRVTSRRAPHLELFRYARMTLHKGKTWDSLVEVVTLQAFPHIREQLPRISGAYYIGELANLLLPERQEHRDVFDWFVQTLSRLDVSTGSAVAAVIEEAANELLVLLGFLPAGRRLARREITPFIEEVAERRLRTDKVFRWPGSAETLYG